MDRNMLKTIFASLLSAAMFCPLAGQPAAADQGRSVVRGRVFTAAGLPLADATISANQTALPKSGPPETVQTQTGSDGRFQFNGISGQSYLLCVYNAGEHLDPCKWSGAPRIQAGANSDELSFAVQPGVPLYVTIKDPGALLSARNTAAGVYLVNSTGEIRIPIPLATATRDRFEYYSLVPDDSAWSIMFDAHNLKVKDAKGDVVEVGSRLAIPRPPQKMGLGGQATRQPPKSRFVSIEVGE